MSSKSKGRWKRDLGVGAVGFGLGYGTKTLLNPCVVLDPTISYPGGTVTAYLSGFWPFADIWGMNYTVEGQPEVVKVGTADWLGRLTVQFQVNMPTPPLRPQADWPVVYWDKNEGYGAFPSIRSVAVALLTVNFQQPG